VSNIQIVTDSTADIPLLEQQAFHITVAQLKIQFGSEAFRDADLSGEAFYDKLASSPSLPTTSQPSPLEFLEIYQGLLADGAKEIISIHLSSALSGTYQSAVLAGSMLVEQEEHLQGKIHIIDSLSASYGIGVLAVAAAKAAQEGLSSEQIVERVWKTREDFKIYFLVDTLTYLQKGGRIGKASALLGSLLNIKPILSIDKDGEVIAIDKVRGQKKAMARIIEMMERDIPRKKLHMHVAHANNMEAAAQFRELIEANFEVLSAVYIDLGSVVGTHVGPGTIAAFVSPV
jgi:DegV family protein with EDD domain